MDEVGHNEPQTDTTASQEPGILATAKRKLIAYSRKKEAVRQERAKRNAFDTEVKSLIYRDEIIPTPREISSIEDVQLRDIAVAIVLKGLLHESFTPDTLIEDMQQLSRRPLGERAPEAIRRRLYEFGQLGAATGRVKDPGTSQQTTEWSIELSNQEAFKDVLRTRFAKPQTTE